MWPNCWCAPPYHVIPQVRLDPSPPPLILSVQLSVQLLHQPRILNITYRASESIFPSLPSLRRGLVILKSLTNDINLANFLPVLLILGSRQLKHRPSEVCVTVSTDSALSLNQLFFIQTCLHSSSFKIISCGRKRLYLFSPRKSPPTPIGHLGEGAHKAPTNILIILQFASITYSIYLIPLLRMVKKRS
jgi:hypothetical protein